jgi:hypothetical protein
MLRVYIVIIVVGLLGGVGFGAWKYYNDTQQRIQTLAENNAKLEVAIAQSEASIDALTKNAAQNAQLTLKLQKDLQKAERYSDNLQKRLRQLDLSADALTDPENLEGRMNGATAKLWRNLMGETGNDTGSSSDLPHWLQQTTGTEGGSGNTSTEVDSANSGTPSTD